MMLSYTEICDQGTVADRVGGRPGYPVKSQAFGKVIHLHSEHGGRAPCLGFIPL